MDDQWGAVSRQDVSRQAMGFKNALHPSGAFRRIPWRGMDETMVAALVLQVAPVLTELRFQAPYQRHGFQVGGQGDAFI